MTAIVVLGAGADQLHLIRTAHEMGLDTVALDRNPDAPGLALATHGLAVDFGDVAASVAAIWRLAAEGVEMGGVLTMGCDCTRSLAAIGERCGWQAPSQEAARLATDKLLMSEAWRVVGVPAVHVHPSRYGSVVRPRDGSGARGALYFGSDSIVSRYEPGPQVSTETILYDGRAVTFLADRNYDDTSGFAPLILENGGWYPCSLPDDTQAAIRDLVERGARALGIERGTAKGDVVVTPDGPQLIEMAARLSGGDLCESLVPLGCGVNYVRQAIEIALDREPTWSELEPQPGLVVANRYLFTPPGRLGGLDFKSHHFGGAVRKFEVWPLLGSDLPPIECHAQRRGVFVVAGESREDVQAVIDDVYLSTRFRVSGEHVSGDPRTYR